MTITLKEEFLSQFQTTEQSFFFVYMACKADKEGRLTISQSDLEKVFGVTRNVVRNVLKYLEMSGMIAIESNNKSSVITILKGHGYSITTTGARVPKDKPVVSEEEKRFQEWMKSKFPSVARMQYPLTYDDMQSIQKVYPDKNMILETLIEMENWKQLNSKNKYAKLTLLNWLRRHGQK